MWFIILLQLTSPCPPTLSCNNLPSLQTTSPITATANPNVPAKWFAAGEIVEVGIFEWYAIKSGNNTISQWSQDESKKHISVKVFLLTGMSLLTWHLIWGF